METNKEQIFEEVMKRAGVSRDELNVIIYGADYADLMFRDLLEEGWVGQELLSKFKELRQAIREAVQKILEECRSLPKDEAQTPEEFLKTLFD